MEEHEYLITGAKLDEVENPYSWDDSDPFMKSWDEVKTYKNIQTNFKRRATRVEKAVPTDRLGKPSDAYLSDARADGQSVDRKTHSKQINPGVVYRTGYGIFDVITPPYNLYELASFYDTSFANHAAIDAKVANTIGMGYEFEMTADTQIRMEAASTTSAKEKAKKRIDQLKISLDEWLNGLNDEDNLTKILEKCVIDLQSTGNAYIEVGRTTNGDIGYIGHIPATTIRARRLRDGYVQIVSNVVVYFRNFQATNINPITDDPRPNEIIHLKEYSPLNTYYGVPDIVSAYSSLRGDQLAQQYNLDYFDNKAVPRYIIVVKGARLSVDAEDKLFRFFQNGLRGQNHRTLYLPIPGDDPNGQKVEFEMKPIEAGVQEASFDKYRQRNRDDILMAHQVPLSKLGGVDASAVAAAMTQDRTFRDQVAKPLQEYIAKAVNKIIKEKTDVLTLVFLQASLTDEVAESQIIERYVRNQVMLPNEARERLHLPAREGGDKPFEMSSRLAADSAANSTQGRARDSARSSAQSDGSGAVSGRNPKGEGSKTN